MPLIVIFDFIIPHQIIVLFIMVLLSNVGIFMTFCYFAENKEVRGDTGFLAKFRAYKIVFTSLSYTLHALSSQYSPLRVPTVVRVSRIVSAKQDSKISFLALIFGAVFLVNLINSVAIICCQRNG